MRLMLAFQAGNAAAFDRLVERNVKTVHALVYRFLREASMLDDITQEVFLRVYRYAPRYQPSAKFSTWLYRITANLCFNVMRSRKKRRAASLDAMGDDDSHREVPDPSQPSPQADLDAEERRRLAVEAVNRLPENQRLAIVLNKFHDLSYEDIAETMETTTMAVKSLLSRARANLRDDLQRQLKTD
ncbi:MAG: sigma-70 family RNA polymerase sigma factor [Planctomycetes bacterium]|nr:sigma-70 family RNA polymerase sigma factor [Planctomycetota bacterium]